jgi:hypothetical protein
MQEHNKQLNKRTAHTPLPSKVILNKSHATALTKKPLMTERRPATSITPPMASPRQQLQTEFEQAD